MSNEIKKFNLRVYGLLIRNGKVLITDENRNGTKMTKFPGGGLEFGEGLEDCVIREFQEELGIRIKVKSFFYTNEFLQISRYNAADQLHSFYFLVDSENDLSNYIEEGLKEVPPNSQRFRWVSLSELDSNQFTFPIDRIVVDRLRT